MMRMGSRLLDLGEPFGHFLAFGFGVVELAPEAIDGFPQASDDIIERFDNAEIKDDAQESQDGYGRA